MRFRQSRVALVAVSVPLTLALVACNQASPADPAAGEQASAAPAATAQSQGDMVKELLARISQPAPAGKAKGKAAAAG